MNPELSAQSTGELGLSRAERNSEVFDTSEFKKGVAISDADESVKSVILITGYI
jgi:hypothetical protein